MHIQNLGWLFAVINRIAEGVAMNEWECYQLTENGLPARLLTHPYLALWEDINPYYTRQDFLVASEQHFRLVGEAWWVIVSDKKRHASRNVANSTRQDGSGS